MTRETEVEDILLVRAFDEADEDGRILTKSMRDRARAPLDPAADPHRARAARAEPIAKELHALLPGLAHAMRWMRLDDPAPRLTVIAAFVIGMAAHALGTARMFNVLQMPFLGLCAWNIFIYALLVRRGLGPRHAPSGAIAAPALGAAHDFLLGLFMKIGARSLRRRAETVDVATRALARYFDRWRRAAAPLLAARAERLFHLGAAALTFGLVAGMYLRGLVTEYRADWESTFLSEAQAAAILRFFLLPASALTRIPVELAKNGPAAPWIHLYAATAAIFVVLPRLILALGAARRAAAAAQGISSDAADPFAAAGEKGGPAHVRIVAFSYAPSPRVREHLNTILARLFGERARLDPCLLADYADEWDEAAARAAAPGATFDVLVFSMAQTPEIEVHGRFTADAVRTRKSPNGVLVLVDSSTYLKLSADQAKKSAADAARAEAREAAWRNALSESGAAVVFCDLLETPDRRTVDAVGAAFRGATWKS